VSHSTEPPPTYTKMAKVQLKRGVQYRFGAAMHRPTNLQTCIFRIPAIASFAAQITLTGSIGKLRSPK
jgi:hypothetical protein